MNNKLAGRFTKVARTENSVVVGLVGSLTAENIERNEILEIAVFYGINTEPDKFGYHFTTAEGAIKRGCKLPVNNFNGFIEIFAQAETLPCWSVRTGCRQCADVLLLCGM